MKQVSTEAKPYLLCDACGLPVEAMNDLIGLYGELQINDDQSEVLWLHRACSDVLSAEKTETTIIRQHGEAVLRPLLARLTARFQSVCNPPAPHFFDAHQSPSTSPINGEPFEA
jgi:hypothetical protein